jgi:acyl-CoA synthetase (AMP-forming)/AMP-acid ligase II
VSSPSGQPTTIAQTLLRTADRRPGHEALVFSGDGRFTYADVRSRSVRVARSLAALGVGRGDHVGLLMPNCPDFVFTFFGAQLLGAVVVPVNTRFRARELGYVVEHADLSVLLTTDIADEHVDYAERTAEGIPGLTEAAERERLALRAAPRLRAVVLLGDREPRGMLPRARFEELADQVDEAHVLAEAEQGSAGDAALMLYTSGTTAHPKGCLITHDAVLHVWCSAARRLRITEDDRMWDGLPLFHMSCLGPLLFMTDLAGTLVTAAHFEPSAALDAIERERATWLYSVFPPIIMALLKEPSFPGRDLSSVRGMLNVAPPETMRLIQAAFPRAVNVGGHFGMTEASGAITCNEWDATPDQQAETHGAPLPDIEVRAVDPETGAELPAGCPGELLVRGRGLFLRYHRDPEATEAALRGGWLHSGDLGVIDEDGLVTYLARLKDMLKVGGENVAPAEIESHLSTHPAVKLVQVVGAPDERLGEVPAAFIELSPGRTWSEEEAIDYCRGQIASFKVPRYVRFVTEWPMSATKIQKFRLREQLASELRPEASRETTVT